MIAVDTNVVLRLILGDDREQTAAVTRLMERTAIFVSATVLVETGWVLESRYRLSRDQVANAIEGLVALDGVEIARSRLVGWALERYRAGADWADLIHIITASKLDGFVTFDRDLYRLTRDGSPVPVDLPR